MRGPEALHPAAFLVDQNGRVPAQDVAERLNKLSDLIRGFDVALEEDEPPGLGRAQERALVGGNRRSGQSRDEYVRRHRGD
jgi:hypothetical protein